MDDVRGDLVTVTIAGSGGGTDRIGRYRNHATPSLLAAVRRAGRQGWIDTRYGLLFLESWPGDPEAVFSLQPADEPWPACR